MRKYSAWAIFGLISGVTGLPFAACSVGTNGTGATRDDGSIDGSADGSGGDDSVEQDAIADRTEPADVRNADGAVDATEDVGPGHDAAADGSVADGNADGPVCTLSSCAGACCANQCVTSCAGCSVGTLFCPFSTTVVNSNGQCVSSCSTCAPDGVALDAAAPNGSCSM